MQNRIFVFFALILVFWLVLPPAWGETVAANQDQNVDLMVAKSGVKEQLGDLAAMMQEQFTATSSGNEQEQSQITTIIQNDFTSEKVIQEIKQTFAQQYRESDTNTVLRFYNSELATRLTQYEIASSNSSFKDKLVDFKLENYSKKRQAIITKFFDSAKVLDFYYLLSSAIMESSMASLNAMLPESFKKDIAKVLTDSKKKLKKQIYSVENRQSLLSSYYLIYEQATDDEMIEYTKFINSSSGKWMQQCINTGMINGFKKCTQTMIDDILRYKINTEPTDSETGNSSDNV